MNSRHSQRKQSQYLLLSQRWQCTKDTIIGQKAFLKHQTLHHEPVIRHILVSAMADPASLLLPDVLGSVLGLPAANKISQ